MPDPIRKSQRRTNVDFAQYGLWWAGLAWLPTMVLAAGIGALAILAFAETDQSALEQLLFIPRFMAAGFGFSLISLMCVHVAAGTPRRHVLAISGLTGLAFCVVTGALTALAFYAEGLIFSANGWTHRFDNDHLFTANDQFGLITAEYFMTNLVYFLGGWLIAAAFFRQIKARFLVIFLALCGAMVVEASAGVGWIMDLIDLGTPPNLPVAAVLPVSVIVIAAESVAVWSLLRTAPIRPWLEPARCR